MSSQDYDDSFDSILADLVDIPVTTSETSSITSTNSTNTAKKSNLVSNTTGSNNVQQKSSSSAHSNNVTIIKKQPAIQSNTIAVNSKQRGNPILKSITNVPWEFCDDIIPDYIVGATACILYLSLKYHNLNPDYINNRLKELGKMYELRILLVQVDTKVIYNFPFYYLYKCLLKFSQLILNII